METWLFNHNNYFLNKTNWFGATSTLKNTLAIPKDISKKFLTIFFYKVLTPKEL